MELGQKVLLDILLEGSYLISIDDIPKNIPCSVYHGIIEQYHWGFKIESVDDVTYFQTEYWGDGEKHQRVFYKKEGYDMDSVFKTYRNISKVYLLKKENVNKFFNLMELIGG